MSTSPEPSVRIEFGKPFDGQTQADIQELSDLLTSNPNLRVEPTGEDGPAGAKPILTPTLAVIGAVTGVAGLVLQAIAIWKQDKPRYSVAITDGDRTCVVDNMSHDEYLDTLKRLNRGQPNAKVAVEISQREKT